MKRKTGQKSAAEWAELAVLSSLQVAQKAIERIQFIGLFLLWYSTPLETYRVMSFIHNSLTY